MLAADLEKALVEIHGRHGLEGPISHVVVPLQQPDWLTLIQAPPGLVTGHLVRLNRQPADLICSLARFPHLQPCLPCPRDQRVAFFQAALQSLQGEEALLGQLELQLTGQGIRRHHLHFEELVGNPQALVRLRRSLGLSESEQPPLAGISPSLCFRERPLDQASLGRWQRQLSTEERQQLAPIPPGLPPLSAPEPSDPLILTGRGGSGTRLLADAVISQGLDLGARLNASSDSIQWADLLYEMALSALQGHSGPWSGNWAEELRHRARCLALQRPPSQPWGFKLPEVMLVPEALLQTWPGSTLVHLVRHPLDTCLRRTHMTSRTSNPVGKALLEQAYSALGRRQSPEEDPPHLRNAVSWWYQLQEIQRVRQQYPARLLELRYEDLCDQPQATTHGLMQALGLPSRPVGLTVDPSRRRRWNAGDERIDQVWALCGSLAEIYGYSAEA
ncbi:sulfotransferase family protein [Vulcanococcus limneticus]|uniref:sulfotransferase family protein n=1 Tax=Vulcanococcus limneticus TaxID=2170428 RepID=UPI00398BE478